MVTVNHHVRGSSPRWGAIKNMADFLMRSAFYFSRPSHHKFFFEIITYNISMLEVLQRIRWWGWKPPQHRQLALAVLVGTR